MTTPPDELADELADDRPDELIEDALDRADTGLLARRLDAGTCPTRLLGRLIRHQVDTERAEVGDDRGPVAGVRRRRRSRGECARQGLRDSP